MTSKPAIGELASYVEELLETKGLEFTKRIFETIVIQATQDNDKELQEASLSILATLKEIDEEKN